MLMGFELRDSILTLLGRSQTEALGTRLEALNAAGLFDAFVAFVSPLDRARKTAVTALGSFIKTLVVDHVSCTSMTRMTIIF